MVVSNRVTGSSASMVAGTGSRIVMTTALEDHRSVFEAISSSADGYVVKPVEKVKLLATLHELGLDISQPN